MKRTIALATLIILGALSSLPTGPCLWDLGTFVVSARSVSIGANPYSASAALLTEPNVSLDPSIGTKTSVRSLNPPIITLLFQPTAWADALLQFRAYYLLSLLAYLVLVGLLVWAYGSTLTSWRLIWLFALAPVWHSLFVGNVYMLLALGSTVAWLLVERGRWTGAGIALGLAAALKVNLLLIPVLLFLAGYRRTGVVALAVFALAWSVPAVIDGPSVYAQWLAIIPPAFPASAEYWGYVMNSSLVATFGRLGLTYMGFPLSVLLLICSALCVWRTRPLPLEVMGFAVVLGTLASPVGHDNLFLCLLPAFASRPAWGTALGVAATAMLIPRQIVWSLSLMGSTGMALAGSIYFAAYALVLVDLAWGSLRGHPARPQLVAAR